MPSTCTVTGNIQLLTGSAATSGLVTFSLVNHTDQLPRVLGTAMLAQPTYTATPDGSGNISIQLWGNDNISPAGTYYRVTAQSDTSGNVAGALGFQITGGSFNLNSATPIDTAPVVAAPTGDTTYLRTDAGNTSLTGTNPFAFGRVDNIRFADQFPGATTAAKILAAETDLAGKGLVVVASTMPADSAVPIPLAGVTILDLRGYAGGGGLIQIYKPTGSHYIAHFVDIPQTADGINGVALWGDAREAGRLVQGSTATNMIGVQGMTATAAAAGVFGQNEGSTYANLPGTISSTGTTVNGSSTTFQTSFVVGSLIQPTSGAQATKTISSARRITAITSDILLTVASAWPADVVAGSTYAALFGGPGVQGDGGWGAGSKGVFGTAGPYGTTVNPAAGVWGVADTSYTYASALGGHFESDKWFAIRAKSSQSAADATKDPAIIYAVGSSDFSVGYALENLAGASPHRWDLRATGNSDAHTATSGWFYLLNKTDNVMPLAVTPGALENALLVDSTGISTVGRVKATKAVISGLNVVTFSATPTFDASLGNTQKITLTGNVTSSTLSNATAGQVLHFTIFQDATGSRTFVWPTNVKGGMTIGSTLSTCSAQSFIFDGTNAYALSPGVTNMATT